MTDFKLNSSGLAEVLKSREVAAVMHQYAEKVAQDVATQHPDTEEGVVVDDYVTDRAASSVTIRDARGRIWQVRDGVLTRAAERAGLEVTERRT